MSLPRRTVLRRSVLGTVAVAGCLGFGGTSDEIDVVLENADDTAHRLSVTVSFDRSTLFDETVTLAADGSARHTIENPETAGSATVLATLDGSGRARTEVRVGPGTGTRDVFVTVDADGHLSVYAGRT